jgi:hypothetical protein
MRAVDEPDDQPSLAGDIGRALTSSMAPVVEETVSAVVLIVFMLLFVPIGIVVFIATGAIFGTLVTLIGAPTGTLGAILGLTWFGGTLALLLVVFVAIYRRLPRRVRESIAEPPAAAPPRTTAVAGPTLAELDARFAPRPMGAPEDPPTGP